jgi:hypothetical protein
LRFNFISGFFDLTGFVNISNLRFLLDNNWRGLDLTTFCGKNRHVHHIGEVGIDHRLIHVDDLKTIFDQDLATGDDVSRLFVTVVILNFGEESCNRFFTWQTNKQAHDS